MSQGAVVERGRVAVVTGAASGIGLGLARRCAADGMKVVMADVNEAALLAAAAEVATKGAEVLAVQTDVSNRDSVAELAARTKERFGATHLLFNNAGVERLAPLTETPLEAYEWVIGVNLWGVIYGLNYFLPDMVARDDGYIVNTASAAALLVGTHGNGAYAATKSAVLTLSEVLYHELAEQGSRVGVSVLCPGTVRTNLLETERNWPDQLGDAPPLSDHALELRQAIVDRANSDLGMEPSEAADIVMAHVQWRRFWIQTHPSPGMSANIKARWSAAADGENPVLPGAARKADT